MIFASRYLPLGVISSADINQTIKISDCRLLSVVRCQNKEHE
jgi:hypothetical protein